MDVLCHSILFVLLNLNSLQPDIINDFLVISILIQDRVSDQNTVSILVKEVVCLQADKRSLDITNHSNYRKIDSLKSNA